MDDSSGDPGPGTSPQAGPIRYTRTRVDVGAGQHLHQQPGVMRNDRSPLAETLRLLRSQVLQSLRADGHRLLAVTSPRALPGQALAATNLALALAAELDSTVLLVDADLHSRGVQGLFGLDRSAGLAEHLSAGAELPDLLVHPGLPRLVLLPAGASAPAGSAELLASRAAQASFTEFKTRYANRYVVVHLPPVLDSADTLAFLPQADTTLMLVQQQGTSLADLELAAERLAPFPLLGAVMLPAR